MRTFGVLAAGLVVAIFMAGCMGDKAEQVEGRTVDVYLIVMAGLQENIGLYPKNDNTTMEVVWLGFRDAENPEKVLPNPQIGGPGSTWGRIYEGDTVRIHLESANELPHTLHLHGGLIPWEMDGVDYLTEIPLMRDPTGNEKAERTYVFEDMKAGTYWYHCHVDGAHHIDLGMYGAFIVEEREPDHAFDRQYVVMLDEVDNCHVHGNTATGGPATQQEQSGSVQDNIQCAYRVALDTLAQTTLTQVGNRVPADVRGQVCPVLAQMPEDTAAQRALKLQLQAANGCLPPHAHSAPPPQQAPKAWWYDTMPIYVPEYNTYLVNGKAFPDTPVFPVKEGETVLFRLINAGNEWHTFHPHGHSMLVTHTDGYALEAPYRKDTLSIGPGERYDVIITMDNPGLWMVHDQNGLATMNDNQHPGGMMSCIAYDGFHGFAAFNAQRALDCNTYAVDTIHGGHAGH